MDKSTFILWGSVGAAALLVVVVVGFVIPVGDDGSSAQPAGPAGGSVARPDISRLRPLDRAALSPEEAIADRARRAEMREEWDTMTEEEREQFRQQTRDRLAESMRQSDLTKRRADADERKRRENFIKQRQESTAEVIVDKPDVQTP